MKMAKNIGHINFIFSSSAFGGNNCSQALPVTLNYVSTLLHW